MTNQIEIRITNNGKELNNRLEIKQEITPQILEQIFKLSLEGYKRDYKLTKKLGLKK